MDDKEEEGREAEDAEDGDGNPNFVTLSFGGCDVTKNFVHVTQVLKLKVLFQFYFFFFK
jgi:hypothetical protein